MFKLKQKKKKKLMHSKNCSGHNLMVLGLNKTKMSFSDGTGHNGLQLHNKLKSITLSLVKLKFICMG